jgi:hypothetical protein
MFKFRKLVLSFLASLILLTSFFPFLTTNAYAQTSSSSTTSTWYNQNFKDWFSRVYDSPPSDVFGERYTAAQVQWIIYGFFAFIYNTATGSPKITSCMLTGKNLALCKVDELFNSLLDQFKSKIPGASSSNQSVLGFIFLQDRPLSGITYFRNVGRNWHIVPEAKAQVGAGAGVTTGFGFGALDPVLPMWRASRNIAYGVLVLAVIVLAFMIMFRVKINPQTAISVQSAIPKVVVALILITFSYAIAGFAIDLMYVVIGFISLILSQAYSSIGTSSLPFLATSPRDLFGYMTIGPSVTLPVAGTQGSGIIGAMLLYLVLFSLSAIASLLGATGITGYAALSAGAAIAAGATVLSGVGMIVLAVMFLVLFIAMLLFVLRVLWTLLRAFAYVTLLTVFAPLQIALGVIIPQIGFSVWLKSLASNLAVFPLTGALLSLAFYFLFLAWNLSMQSFFSSPMSFLFGGARVAATPGWPPLLAAGSGAAQGLVFLGVSMMMFALIPKVADVIQGIISGRPFAYGTAIGEAVVSPAALVTGVAAARATPGSTAEKTLKLINQLLGGGRR